MSLQVSKRDDDVTGIEFFIGNKYSIDQNNIEVFSGAGKCTLSSTSASGLTASSSTDLPYQLFEIQTGSLNDNDKNSVNWEGICDVGKSTQNVCFEYDRKFWEYISTAENNKIEITISAVNHVKDGKVKLLLQSRSDGNLAVNRQFKYR